MLQTFSGYWANIWPISGKLEQMGESRPVAKVSSCSPIAMGWCLGNPWKRARTVPLKRTSDFELPASEVSMSRFVEKGRSGGTTRSRSDLPLNVGYYRIVLRGAFAAHAHTALTVLCLLSRNWLTISRRPVVGRLGVTVVG